tara:strand:- start:3914 stop:4252 length:339 start_codon:yes stop_codon:yes gene_type:complete
MQTTRQKKISKLIQKEISLIFQKEKHDLLGNILVTVTSVKVTADLSISKIFLSIFPVKNPKETLDIINNNNKFYRNLLARSLRHNLRKVPEIIFLLDDSAAYAEEIDRLLNK